MERQKEVKVTSYQGKPISCIKCGTPFPVYPTASEYISTMRKRGPLGDTQQGFFKLEDYEERNIFYWHKEHREEESVPSVGQSLVILTILLDQNSLNYLNL